MLCCMCIVLTHWNNSVGRHVVYWDTLSWYQDNQSLLLLLYTACLEEKQQIPIAVFGLTWLGFYDTRGECANNCNTQVVLLNFYCMSIPPQPANTSKHLNGFHRIFVSESFSSQGVAEDLPLPFPLPFPLPWNKQYTTLIYVL
jgi:hypothetical protein